MAYGFGKASFEPTATDAFGRLRISDLISQFEAKFTYGVEEKLYNTVTALGGTSTFLTNEAAYSLTVDGQNGSRVLRESFRYLHYYPGKSQIIQLTGVFGTGVANCVKRIGYYDDNDGLFFIQNGTMSLGICRRTSTSGSPVDNIVYSSSWNIDQMNGQGPSGITLDPTKAQIMIIDFQWLGVGAVRFGFVVDGAIYYVHQMNHANSLDRVYMKSAWLPLRYEIVNVGTNTGSSLKQICSAVSSEGGIEPVGNLYCATSDLATNVGTAWLPVLSIRVNTTLNSLPFRGKIQVQNYDTIATGTNPAQFAIVENPTLTGASWQTVASSSAVSFDRSATAYSGGIPRSYIFNARSTNASKAGTDELSGYAGTVYTIICRGIGGNSAGLGVFNWREII